MATPTTLPDTPAVVSGNTRPNMFGTGFPESDGLNDMITNIYNAWVRLGVGSTTPDAIHKALKATAAGTTSFDYHFPVKLDEVTVTGSPAAQIDFTNINQHFRSLVVLLSSLNDTAAANILMRLSSDGTTFDSGNNYDRQTIAATNTTVTGVEALAASSMVVGFHGAAANVAGLVEIAIGNYAGTAHQKAVLAHAGRKNGTSSGDLTVAEIFGEWRNTAAAQGIRLFPSANNFAVGSRATLLGLP